MFLVRPFFPLFCRNPFRNASVLLLFVVSCLNAQALNPNLPPGGNFNLTNWYLGLPVDSSGGTSGNSASISAALLTAGYSNALYFYTGPDGAMTFWAPVTGATTPGSSYPRSELREQISPPSNEINWKAYGTHLLTAQCRVTQVPSTKKVIIGQIHTKTGDARPLVKLQYNDGTIEGLVKIFSSETMPNTDNKFTFQNVGLNNLIDYAIRMENGLVTVTVNGLSKSTNVFLTDSSWATNGFYFKAGSYCQDNVGDASEGARVAFYSLARDHAPSITNQPASVAVAAGSDVTFSVGAAGNGALQYQWRLNDTNLPGATGSALNLTNVQVAQAGDYSVRVSDTLGAVTSVVAQLTVTNAPTNTPPMFNSNPIIKSNATVNSPYNGTLALDVTDPDAGDVLTFSKVSGPTWLTVAPDGNLSGMPGTDDVGTNDWTIRVTDLSNASSEATLRIVVNAASSSGSVTNVIVDDSWADGGRNNGPDPLDADWWSSTSSSGNSIEVYPGQLGLISGSAGRGIHGIFASQSLGIGETLMATFDFLTPATVGTAKSASFRIGLFDTTGHLPGLAADLSASSASPNANYNNLNGYMMDLDVNTGNENINFRERTNAASGQLMATADDFENLSGGGSAYSFVPNTAYRGVFSVMRTASDKLELRGELYQGATLLSAHTASDTNDITATFGMLAFHVGSSTFGSSTTAGQAVDNGITFTNIKIQRISPAPENHPPTPGAVSVVTGQAIPVDVAISTLLAVASDPDGDALEVSGVNPLSANGGSVTLTNVVIRYAPLAGFTGNDQCTYKLSDGRGGSSDGVFTVTVISSNAITLVPKEQKLFPDNSVVVTYEGVPGLSYTVDRATDLAGPWELAFTNVLVGDDGVLQFVDPNTPHPPQRFYRTRYP